MSLHSHLYPHGNGIFGTCQIKKSQSEPSVLGLYYSNKSLTGLIVLQQISLCTEWKRVSCKCVKNHETVYITSGFIVT